MLRNYLPIITVKTAAELLRDHKGTVADIACGKGTLKKMLSPSNGKRVFGIDRTQEHTVDANSAGTCAVTGNILEMPFKDGVHAHFTELLQEPDDIRSKMYLYHYQPDPPQDAKAAGFLGFVTKGSTFEVK